MSNNEATTNEAQAPVDGPAWIYQCPVCNWQQDIKSSGWVRKHAYSWGQRRMMRCPVCEKQRCLRVLHVDADGQPDQSFSRVLRKTLILQVKIVLAILILPLLIGIPLLTVFHRLQLLPWQ